jgi:hypothetical protein
MTRKLIIFGLVSLAAIVVGRISNNEPTRWLCFLIFMVYFTLFQLTITLRNLDK